MMQEVSPRAIVFLLFEGLPPTIVESQVFAHASAMHHVGFEIEIWTFACRRKTYTDAVSRTNEMKSYEVPLRVFRGVHRAWPWADWVNARRLARAIVESGLSIGVVHARTEMSAAVAARAKKRFDFKLLWDTRGDTSAEARYSAPTLPIAKRLLKSVLFARIRSQVQESLTAADYALFVTPELHEVVAPGVPDDRYSVVPCLADAQRFFFDQDLRRAARLDLGIKDEEILFVFSGSLSKWQCFPETVDYLVRVMRGRGDVWAIFLTPEPAEALRQVPETERGRVTALYAAWYDVNAYLNAADFGIMFREVNAVNRVASPVKFAEYCLAGLPVIMTDGVPSAVRVAQALGNMRRPSTDGSAPERLSNEARGGLAAAAGPLLSRGANVGVYVAIYRSLLGAEEA